MSSTNLSMAESALHARVREKLNAENIKLWTEPFYDDSSKGVVDGEIIALASRYSTELKLEESETIDCLFTLQRNALERLAERQLLKNTGLSTVRIKLSGFSIGTNIEGNSVQRIQVNLSVMSGKELRARVAELSAVDKNRLKLICLGRVIKDEIILEQQNVKNGSQIMVLCVIGSGNEQDALKENEDQFRQMEETRGAADYLAGKDQSNFYSLQVADQHGKALELPPLEKKALAVALAFHEKGRGSMKVGDFGKALVFLLEADSVYSQCQTGILDMVDNYGMLNLDIAWCYLTLQSIAELPAVEMRLGKCEKALHRSYGENMERVIALKGSSGSEAALFVRLHLLQGIAAYHLGQIEKSKFYITKVENEIERLRVSDEQLADLINMGYNEDESTMALRATYGNLEAAVNHILQKREEEVTIQRQEKEDRRRQKLQKRLGNTDHGEPVNVSLFQTMKEMGYNATLVNAALKRANNDVNDALQLVLDNFFISSVISEAAASTSNAGGRGSRGSQSQPMNTFSPSELPPISPSLEMLMSEAFDVDNTPEEVSPEELERSQKAFENLSKDMGSESDYIDLTLSAETEYLQQYKNLLRF